MFKEIKNTRLKWVKLGNVIFSISLYTISGWAQGLPFPWFIGNALGEFEFKSDDYDGFVMLLIFAWLVVFISNAYFIYIDTKKDLKLNGNIYYSILYLFGYYQFIFILSIRDYYQNLDYYFLNKINYISALLLLGINSYIFSVNKYLLPKYSENINIFFINLLLFIYILLFLYETVFGSIIPIPNNSFLFTKCSEIFLFFGSQSLTIFYVTYKEIEQIKQNKKIDEVLYNMRIEVRNEKMRKSKMNKIQIYDQTKQLKNGIYDPNFCYDEYADSEDIIDPNESEQIAFVI